MIIPELPAYLSQLGGQDYKGLIIALFTVTAGLSRPFSGKLTDKIGRRPILFMGVSVAIVCAILYPFVSSIFGFFIIRLLHGFCAGTTPTASSAMLADLVPPSRRGEAMGLMGFIVNIGTAISPVLGSEIAKHYSIEVLFYASALLGVCSGLLFLLVKETIKHKQPFQWAHLHLTRRDIFEPTVLNPTVCMLFGTFGFGAVLTVMPDISVHLGIANKGLAMMFYTIASLSVRILAGKVSDQFGRITILRYALSLQIIALLLLGFATTPLILFIGAALFGVSMGFISPTILAWAVDLSTEDSRGRSLATVYLAMEAGIGLGAVLGGAVYGNDSNMFAYAFWSAAFFSGIALIYVAMLYRGREYVVNN
jgi:MFS family permease